jgi:SAM-dependent methyltransferase
LAAALSGRALPFHSRIALTSLNPAAQTLTFTGERFMPEVRGPIWYEHWHRYAAVAPLAAGKRVLDAACGEGYGSYLLAHDAAAVTGVDIAPDAVAHAAERYPQPNLHFTVGSVTKLPLPPASVDLIVSFETIEHLREQEQMLAEFRRVLAVDGILVISSPNRPVYNEGGGVENHFHVRELDRAELAALLAPAFPRQAWYAQRVVAQSVLWAEATDSGANSFLTLADHRPAASPAPAPPMYYVVVCGGADAVLPALPAVSLFDDGERSLWSDYARALARERELAWDEINARKVAEDRLAELVPAINELASARAAGVAQAARIAALEAALAATQAKAQAALTTLTQAQAALASEVESHAQTADAHARERAAHGETQARLAYRESARGWLRFPFAAVRHRVPERR